jgi:hypothetical protein
LVAPGIKVLYLPTTKVACTALKFLVAEAEGSLRADRLGRIPSAAPTPAHTIHNVAVSGLTPFASLTEVRQREILESDRWWRVAAIRDPYARMYSSWENRILLRAPSHAIRDFTPFVEVWEEGRLDLGATFAAFIDAIGDRPGLVAGDDHFASQSEAVRPGQVPLTHLLRVDSEGELAAFADALAARAGADVGLRRLNEGLGVAWRSVMTAGVAARIEEHWAEDFERLGFGREMFPEAVPKLLLGERESRLVQFAREVSQRLDVVATEVSRREGARYGMSQILRRSRQWLGRGN